MTVVDASVLVAYYYQDDTGHDAARDWFRARPRDRTSLRAPAIVLSEVSGAIARRAGRDMGVLVQTQLMQPGFLDVHPIGPVLASRASGIAVRLRLKGCDAIYVALAEELGEELITLDAEQIRRGGQVVRVARPG